MGCSKLTGSSGSAGLGSPCVRSGADAFRAVRFKSNGSRVSGSASYTRLLKLALSAQVRTRGRGSATVERISYEEPIKGRRLEPAGERVERATDRTNMNREYHKWYSERLGRDMELLVYGHDGVAAVVFPSSQARFYEFEDRGMVGSIGHKIDNGEIQLYCVDSLDAESWYNRNVPPRWRIARQIQYQEYILNELLPLIRLKNQNRHLISLGCSFGGYHAVNIALRHPDVFTGFLSMSGAFDISNFLHGYYDEDVYFNMPPHYMANMSDPWFLDRYRQNTYVLATGWDDQCLGQNQHLSHLLGSRAVGHQLAIWDSWNSHDWPTWQRMMNVYL